MYRQWNLFDEKGAPLLGAPIEVVTTGRDYAVTFVEGERTLKIDVSAPDPDSAIGCAPKGARILTIKEKKSNAN